MGVQGAFDTLDTETLIGAIVLYGWLAALVGAAALEAGWHLIRRPRA